MLLALRALCCVTHSCVLQSHQDLKELAPGKLRVYFRWVNSVFWSFGQQWETFSATEEKINGPDKDLVSSRWQVMKAEKRAASVRCGLGMTKKFNSVPKMLTILFTLSSEGACGCYEINLVTPTRVQTSLSKALCLEAVIILYQKSSGSALVSAAYLWIVFWLQHHLQEMVHSLIINSCRFLKAVHSHWVLRSGLIHS